MLSTYLLILFFILLISTSFSFSSPSYTQPNPSNYISYIKSACNTTTYPSLCLKTCLPYASKIKADPRKMMMTSISAALSAAQSSALTVAAVSKQANLDKYEANAIRDCIENMGDSIDELKKSIDQMNELSRSYSSKEMKFKISNVQTWMSAAITDENTCMDGVHEHRVSVDVKKRIRGYVLGVAMLTSNALSLCNHLKY